jgi:hypothetical protein
MYRSKESASLGVLLAQGAAIVWSRNAIERAHERGVSKLDAERVIKGGPRYRPGSAGKWARTLAACR